MLEEEVISQNTDTVTDPTEKIPEVMPTLEEGAEVQTEDATADTAPDYEAIVREDIAFLRSQFSELKDLQDISELENPLRYASLRDLGLSAEEAYLATTKKRRVDNRSHLYPSVPRHSSVPDSSMSEGELISARELFPDISDREIRSLYKKVTK